MSVFFEWIPISIIQKIRCFRMYLFLITHSFCIIIGGWVFFFNENNLTLIESMYLFHFIECIFFRKMSQSTNSDSTQYEEDWICLTCNKVAVDPLSLEIELLRETIVILIESNGTRWLKCAVCDRRYHFNCVSNIP